MEHKSYVAFSFNVESRDICDEDLNSSIQFLPRYDYILKVVVPSATPDLLAHVILEKL